MPVLSTPYYPTRGLYSSSNAKLVLAQMKEIADAGVDTVVVSWWGFDSPEADRLPLVVQAAQRHGLSIALHVEPYSHRTPARAAEDIARLHQETGVVDFYLYDADRDSPEAWAAALGSLSGVRVFGHTTRVGRAKASGFDGLYTYDVVTWNGSIFKRLCTQAHAAGLLCAPSVGPGYDARLATRHEVVRDRQNGTTYDRMWKTAIRASADVVTITSYNEWQEGHPDRAGSLAGRPPELRRCMGQEGGRRAACVPDRDCRVDREVPREDRSVEGRRESASIRDRHRVFVAEVVEHGDCQLAQPLALLR